MLTIRRTTVREFSPKCYEYFLKFSRRESGLEIFPVCDLDAI